MLLLLKVESVAPLLIGSKVFKESTTLFLRRGSRSAKESVRQFVALRELTGGLGTGLVLLCEYIIVVLDTEELKGRVEWRKEEFEVLGGTRGGGGMYDVW